MRNTRLNRALGYTPNPGQSRADRNAHGRAWANNLTAQETDGSRWVYNSRTGTVWHRTNDS